MPQGHGRNAQPNFRYPAEIRTFLADCKDNFCLLRPVFHQISKKSLSIIVRLHDPVRYDPESAAFERHHCVVENPSCNRLSPSQKVFFPDFLQKPEFTYCTAEAVRLRYNHETIVLKYDSPIRNMCVGIPINIRQREKFSETDISAFYIGSPQQKYRNYLRFFNTPWKNRPESQRIRCLLSQ